VIILNDEEHSRLHSASDFLRRRKKTILQRLHSASDFFRVHKKTLFLMVFVAAVTLIASGIVSILLDSTSIISLPSVGYIHTVGVKAYWDPNVQNVTEQIQWGTVYSGSSYNVTLYLQSTSNVPTTLTLETANWTYKDANNTIIEGPSDNTPYMNLTWNYNNLTLTPHETLQTTLTLTTDNSANFITFLINNNIRQFTMDITIQAKEK
jgi:hypothetical protein